MNRTILKLACLGCLLLALMICALLLDLPHVNATDWSQRANTFVGLLIAGLATYLAAVWLVMRGALDEKVDEVYRFYTVPASNTAVGHIILENKASRASPAFTSWPSVGKTPFLKFSSAPAWPTALQPRSGETE